MEAPHVPCHSTRSLRSCRLAGADAEAEFPHGDRQGPRGSHRGVVPGAEDGAGGRREDQRCTDQADGRDETRASRDRYDDARAAPSASRFGYPGDDNGMIMGTFGTPSPCARASVGAGQRARSTGRGPSHVRCGVVWRHPGHVHALEPRHRFRDYGYPGYCGASPAVKQQLTCRGARSPCPAAFGHRGRVENPAALHGVVPVRSRDDVLGIHRRGGWCGTAATVRALTRGPAPCRRCRDRRGESAEVWAVGAELADAALAMVRDAGAEQDATARARLLAGTTHTLTYDTLGNLIPADVAASSCGRGGAGGRGVGRHAAAHRRVTPDPLVRSC